ncbi:MAG: carbon-nitrogen hydrolase family protein, partial [Chloroflexota bacterium]|nr:carbon-nitrogen hydrolase family protein [Chloroflexota bacterium]
MSTDLLSVAAVQLNSGADTTANIDAALAGIDRAAAMGARLVTLPETWTYMGPDEGVAAAAEPIPGSLTDR